MSTAGPRAAEDAPQVTSSALERLIVEVDAQVTSPALERLIAEVAAPDRAPVRGRYDRSHNRHNR